MSARQTPRPNKDSCPRRRHCRAQQVREQFLDERYRPTRQTHEPREACLAHAHCCPGVWLQGGREHTWKHVSLVTNHWLPAAAVTALIRQIRSEEHTSELQSP